MSLLPQSQRHYDVPSGGRREEALEWHATEISLTETEKAGERHVSEAASCRPWNRRVEGPTSAVSGATEGEGNEAKGICRSPALLVDHHNRIGAPSYSYP